jgi:hypothetical protein
VTGPIRQSSSRSMTDGMDAKREASLGRPEQSLNRILARNLSNRSKRDDTHSSHSLLRSASTSKESTSKEPTSKEGKTKLSSSHDDEADVNLQSSSGHNGHRPRLKKVRSNRSKRDVKRSSRSNSPFRTKQNDESQVDEKVASSAQKQRRVDAQKLERALQQNNRRTAGIIRSRSDLGAGRSPLRKEATASHRRARTAALDRPSFEIAAAARDKRPGLARAASDRMVSSQRRATSKQVAVEKSSMMKGSSTSSFASFAPHDHMLSRITARRNCNLRLGSRDRRQRSFDDTEVDNLRLGSPDGRQRSFDDTEVDNPRLSEFDTRENRWDIDFSDDEEWEFNDDIGGDGETSDDEAWSPKKGEKSKSWKKKLVKSGKKKLKSGRKKLKKRGKEMLQSSSKKQLDSPNLPLVVSAKGA